MKKNNKGFSLVELIIVIAIMAILAGALAPALIKYINKSRRSTDIQNADSLRTAVQTALSNPDAADGLTGDPVSFTSNDIANGTAGTGFDATFITEVQSVVGTNKLVQKYGADKKEPFVISVSLKNNTVTVYGGKGSTLTEISPSAKGAWAN